MINFQKLTIEYNLQKNPIHTQHIASKIHVKKNKLKLILLTLMCFFTKNKTI
jgi:hypothetical protein